MTGEELEMLTDLRRICNQAGLFSLEFNAGLSIEAEEAFALRLMDVAEGILRHAKGRKGFVINGEPKPLALDVPFTRVEHEVQQPRERPPGSQPGGTGMGRT